MPVSTTRRSSCNALWMGMVINIVGWKKKKCFFASLRVYLKLHLLSALIRSCVSYVRNLVLHTLNEWLLMSWFHTAKYFLIFLILSTLILAWKLRGNLGWLCGFFLSSRIVDASRKWTLRWTCSCLPLNSRRGRTFLSLGFFGRSSPHHFNDLLNCVERV